MAGGSVAKATGERLIVGPQWSPGLMAGGSLA